MEDLIPLFGIFFVIGVPVMAVSAKFVLQPLLRELIQAIRGGKAEELEDVRERVARLEDHLLTQARQLDQLVEAESFRRQLEAGPSDQAVAGPSRTLDSSG
ncbi:MAG: hypothetical protein ACC682_06130 [Gemmatimonadota bacterium]